MYEEFVPREGSFEEIRIKTLRYLTVFNIFFYSLVICVFFLSSSSDDASMMNYIIFPIIIAYLIYGIFYGIKKQERIFYSYWLLIEENKITRTQDKAGSYSFSFDEVSKIIKRVDGSHQIVITKSPHVIAVPAQLQNISELKAILQKIKPVEEGKLLFFEKKPITLTLIVGGLGIITTTVFSTSSNEVMISLASFILLSIIGFYYYLLQKSEEKIKKNSWLILIVILIILVLTGFKLV